MAKRFHYHVRYSQTVSMPNCDGLIREIDSFITTYKLNKEDLDTIKDFVDEIKRNRKVLPRKRRAEIRAQMYSMHDQYQR